VGSLDAANAAVVVELIQQAKSRGAAILGIFHDRLVREQVATQALDLTPARLAA
jgi:alpha-D-ribose 1-methylphosphonate 5-triphosphate synthase subunit PhnL